MILGYLYAQGLFVCLCLVVGNQERRVQYKARMSKEEKGRGEVFQGAFKTIGQWSQERIFLLLNR